VINHWFNLIVISTPTSSKRILSGDLRGRGAQPLVNQNVLCQLARSPLRLTDTTSGGFECKRLVSNGHSGIVRKNEAAIKEWL
jgi:hypothetical protein